MDKRKEILTAGGRHKTTSSRTHDGEDSENSKGKPRFDPYLENGQSNDHVYPHSRRGQQSSMQLVLFTVGIVSCLLLAIAAVVLCVYCCISHQEGVNRMLDRVLRRKQGQDKE